MTTHVIISLMLSLICHKPITHHLDRLPKFEILISIKYGVSGPYLGSSMYPTNYIDVVSLG